MNSSSMMQLMESLVSKIPELRADGIIGVFMTILFSDPLLDVLEKFRRFTSDRPRRQFRGKWEATYSYIVKGRVRLRGTISEERYWTGIWHDVDERSAYFGAFQLIMNQNGKEMAGRWIGFSQKHREVRIGDWHFRRSD